MNYYNIVTIISTFLLALVFILGVFLNINIKEAKRELTVLEDQIDDIKIDIKRLNIELSVLISPKNIVDYINTKNLNPVKLRNLDVICTDFK